MVYGKAYTGQICEFGEPVFGFAKTALKGNPKWQRMIFLGKVEGQDSYLLYTGSSLILTRSSRRVKTYWISHMAFYSQFNLYSWQYKVGFGGRVVPTKRRVNPRGVTFPPPTGLIQFSSLVDEDAEAVKQKAQEEKMEERELSEMQKQDRPTEVQHDVTFGDGRVFEEEIIKSETQVAYVPKPVVESQQPTTSVSTAASSTAAGTGVNPNLGALPMSADIGLEVPVTPHDLPSSPRQSPTTRAESSCSWR